MSDLSRRGFVTQGIVAAAAALVTLPGCRSENTSMNQNTTATVAVNNEVISADLTLPLDLEISGQSSAEKSGGSILTPDPNIPDPYVDQVGRGCDTIFGDLKSPIVTGTMVRSPIPFSDFDVRNGLKWQIIENQHDYYSLTSKSARANGRYKLFKARASGSKTNELNSNSYSLHICALVRRPKLST